MCVCPNRDAKHPGQPKVGKFDDRLANIDQYVLRLEISMNNSTDTYALATGLITNLS